MATQAKPKPADGKKGPPSKGGVAGALTRKFGGVPAWAILIALALGVYLYRKHTSSTASTGSVATQPSSGSGLGLTGSGDGGGGGGPPSTTPDTPIPTSTGSRNSPDTPIPTSTGSRNSPGPVPTNITINVPAQTSGATPPTTGASKTSTSSSANTNAPLTTAQEITKAGATPQTQAIVKVSPNQSLDIPDVPKSLLNTVPKPIANNTVRETATTVNTKPTASTVVAGTTSNRNAVARSKTLH